eukprot:11764436-Alexandrium_andersonii.AAC.1
MDSAVSLECAKLRQHHHTATAFDMFKAFDRVVRPLALAVMATAGWPVGVLRSYAAFMGALRVRHSFADGLGQLRKRELSLLQGCPFSMAILGLITTPWIRCMKELHTASVPRCLADDFL